MTKHQSFRLTDSGSEASSDSETRRSQAIAFAFAQQAAVLIIAGLILDGGHILRLCAIAVVASWVATAVILIRRNQPTNLDWAIIKYGFWPSILLVLVLGAVLDRVVL
jgi:hypothetical protein